MADVHGPHMRCRLPTESPWPQGYPVATVNLILRNTPLGWRAFSAMELEAGFLNIQTTFVKLALSQEVKQLYSNTVAMLLGNVL